MSLYLKVAILITKASCYVNAMA